MSFRVWVIGGHEFWCEFDFGWWCDFREFWVLGGLL